jgi:hypothetical protein
VHDLLEPGLLLLGWRGGDRWIDRGRALPGTTADLEFKLWQLAGIQ